MARKFSQKFWTQPIFHNFKFKGYLVTTMPNRDYVFVSDMEHRVIKTVWSVRKAKNAIIAMVTENRKLTLAK